MILTVTLNAALDITYRVDRFRPGASHRVGSVRERAGGKGVNVARVLQALGRDAAVAGLVGGACGDRIRNELIESGLADQFVDMPGESRRTVTIVSSDTHPTTFNEPGPTVPELVWDAFRERFRTLLPQASAIVLSGSLPPGLPSDAYALLVSDARAADRPVIVDSSGAALSSALPAAPTVVKPNEAELTEITGEADTVAGARAIRRAGADRVVASLGERGVLAVSEEGAFRACPPHQVDGNPTGAGDAAVAAIAAGLADGLDWVACLREAVAVSASAVSMPLAGQVDLDVAARLRPRVRVTRAR